MISFERKGKRRKKGEEREEERENLAIFAKSSC